MTKSLQPNGKKRVDGVSDVSGIWGHHQRGPEDDYS